jgi:predicted anti-sigma-YlaC factor YlaD
MNCTLIQEYISQWTDSELHPSGEAVLFAHLSTCESCRTFFRNLFTLKQEFSSEHPPKVPTTLDQRILAIRPSTIAQKQKFPWSRLGQTYSFRAIGLAVVFSILFTFVASSFWYRYSQPQQTIVCLTPLPEVEVNGYVVVAQSHMKGLNQ